MTDEQQPQDAAIPSDAEAAQPQAAPAANPEPVGVAPLDARDASPEPAVAAEPAGEAQPATAEIATPETAAAEVRAGGSKMVVAGDDSLPIVEQDGEWDDDARKADILSWAGWPDNPAPARARRGFLMMNEDAPERESSYQMPFAIVRDGELAASTAGVRNCMSNMDNLPPAVSNEMKRAARGLLMGYMGKASKKREAELIAATIAATLAALEERNAAVSAPVAPETASPDPQRAAPPPPHQPAPAVEKPAAPPVSTVPAPEPSKPEDETKLPNRDDETDAPAATVSDPEEEIAGAVEAVAADAAEAMAEEAAAPSRSRSTGRRWGGSGDAEPRPRRGTVELRYAEWKGDEPGGFDGYASTAWHVDSYGTAFAPGAWRKTLNERRNRVVVLWQHHPQNPIGYPVALEEDTYGLRAKARIVEETSLGREAMALLRAGVPMGLSVGFRTIRERPAQPTDPLILDHAPEAIRQDPSKAFVITEAALYEFSVVTFPANEAAAVDAVREADMAHRHAGRLASLADLLVDLRAGRLRPEEEPMLAEFVAAWNDRAPGAAPQEPQTEESAPSAPLTDAPPPVVVDIAPRNRRIDLDIALARYRGLAHRA